MKKHFRFAVILVFICVFSVLVSCEKPNYSIKAKNSSSSKVNSISTSKESGNSQQNSSVLEGNSSVVSNKNSLYVYSENSYSSNTSVTSWYNESSSSQQNNSIPNKNVSVVQSQNSLGEQNSSSKQNISSKENSSSQSAVAIPANDFGVKVVKKYDFNISYNAIFRYETFNDKSSGKTMPYRLHIPKKIKKNKKYPVILFLHGAGEIGTDNEQHLINFEQSFSIAGDLLNEAIIICPQTPGSWNLHDYETGEPNGYLAIAKRIVDSAVKKYNGDDNRIYVTGLSLGSFATWDILDAYPNYFAAAVPVCGGGGSYASESFLNTPIWIYHGTADSTVPYESSLYTYQAIINKGGQNVKFTTLDGVAHNAWDYAYKDRAMFSWLFAQNRRNEKMVDRYKGILEIVSADGTTVISEKNIESLWGSSIGFEEYIEVYFDDEADSLLKQKYRKNKNQTFYLNFFGKRIYDFKFTELPKNKNIKIIKTVNDENYKEIIELLENTLSFNKEINGF